VRVRLLYDWLGSFGTRRKYWRYLRDGGVEVRAFRPFTPVDVIINVSRNHRKLVVADGVRGVLGGLCIGCEWTGETSPDREPWRDTAIDVTGPAAVGLETAFERTWEVAGGVIPDDERLGEISMVGDADVRVICGEPGRERTYRVIELLAAGAVERLWITDAYLVAPPRLFQVLRDAARDGVDVRLLVPGSSDVPFVRNLTRIGYRDLLRAGVRIWEWDGPMLHAKTFVADNRWVRVGSSNLNPSSLMGNWELDVLVDDVGLADAMERQFRRDIARSHEVTRRLLRAPPRISQALPTALERRQPEQLSSDHDHHHHHRHHRRREMRRRAVVALRVIAANAQRSIFGPATLVLTVLGILFYALPRITAYVFGALCLWLAIGAGREAFRRRADR
jgi:cardiolipin synthase